jgi:pimeloyl-ACP methyl ester carboxylesterase
MGGRKPEPVSVRGGVDGIEAHYDDMVDAARLFGAAGTDIAGASFALHGYLFDPGIYSSGLFDPVGAGEFEADLAATLDGPGGLTWLAMECGLIDGEIRAAAAAYLAVDRLDTTRHDLLDGVVDLPGALARGAGELVTTGSIGGAVNRVLTSDPALLDEAVTGIRALGGQVALDILLLDGRAVVRPRGADPDPRSAVPPRNLVDLLNGLARRSRGRHGEIDLRILGHADGRRTVIVDIPGTKSWDPLPNGDVTSLATNVHALTGQCTAYEQGVLAALRRAGVTKTDDVMLVGHSEGGMIAVNAAIDAAAAGTFRVTHVLTTGSPIGAISGRVPSSVQMLALENRGDLVPHLDGATNADKINVTTVTVEHDHGSVGRNHSLEHSYVPGAADVDGSDDASVRAFIESGSGFFDAIDARTTRYLITCAY